MTNTTASIEHVSRYMYRPENGAMLFTWVYGDAWINVYIALMDGGWMATGGIYVWGGDPWEGDVGQAMAKVCDDWVDSRRQFNATV